MPGIQIITMTGKQQAAYQQLIRRHVLKKKQPIPSLAETDLNVSEKSCFGFTLGYQKNDQLCAALTFSVPDIDKSAASSGEISSIYIPESVQIATAGRRLLNAAVTIIKQDFPKIHSILFKAPARHYGLKKLFSEFGFVESRSLSTLNVDIAADQIAMYLVLTDTYRS